MEGDDMDLLKPYRWLVLNFNKFINNYVMGEEAALVVSWWDIIVMTIFTWLVFMFLGPVVDSVYGYINSSQNNTYSANFYTDSDIKTATDLYNVYQWIPYLAIGVIIFYALNYSNMKKGGE
jgi:hypothetical protein